MGWQAGQQAGRKAGRQACRQKGGHIKLYRINLKLKCRILDNFGFKKIDFLFYANVVNNVGIMEIEFLSNQLLRTEIFSF